MKKITLARNKPITVDLSFDATVDNLIALSRHEDREMAIRQVDLITNNAIAKDGRGWDLSNANLSNLDLECFNLERSILNRTQLHSTKLRKANLRNAEIICPGMERTDLSEADLSGANMHALSAQVCNFQGANLNHLLDATGALFHGCNMSHISAINAMFVGSSFYQCYLDGASLKQANLQSCTFNECSLNKASLEGANVAQLTIIKCQMQYVILDNAAGDGLNIQKPTCCDNLSFKNACLACLRLSFLKGTTINAEGLSAERADLTNCNIVDGDFSDTNLVGSRFYACSMPGVKMQNAKLSEASVVACFFIDSNWGHATCEGMNVMNSSLCNSDLRGLAGRCVVFRDSDLSGANLSNAYFYRGVFSGEPPQSMSLRSVDASNVNFMQAYIVADLTEANLQSSKLSYARLNQSIMRRANLNGISSYEASLIKVDVSGANLSGLTAPIFIDRCQGLTEALDDLEGNLNLLDLKQFHFKLEKLIGKYKGRST